MSTLQWPPLPTTTSSSFLYNLRPLPSGSVRSDGAPSFGRCDSRAVDKDLSAGAAGFARAQSSNNIHRRWLPRDRLRPFSIVIERLQRVVSCYSGRRPNLTSTHGYVTALSKSLSAWLTLYRSISDAESLTIASNKTCPDSISH